MVSAPWVDFRASAAAWIDGKLLLCVFTAVEAKAVVFAVCCTLQLLQQKDYGIVHNAEHSRATRSSQRHLLEVEVGTSFKNTVDHCPPGNCSTRGCRTSLKLHMVNLFLLWTNPKAMFSPSMLLALTLKPSSLVISKRRWGWFIYVRFLCLGPNASSSELNPAS